MKLATWNVNSLKVRLPHVQEWLAAHAPDVLCLQETKLEDEKFLTADLEQCGFRCAFTGQKTYNGVAIVSREPPAEVQLGIPDYGDVQRRVVAVTVGEIRVVCVYVPNGESVTSDKYRYKLAWLEQLTAWLERELVAYPRLVVAGDDSVSETSWT